MRLQKVVDTIVLVCIALQFLFWALVLMHLAIGFVLNGGPGAVRQLIIFASPLGPRVGDSIPCDDCCFLRLVVRSLGAASVVTLLLGAIFFYRYRAAIVLSGREWFTRNYWGR